MLHQLFRPKVQSAKKQTLIKNYISSCRLKSNKNQGSMIIPPNLTSINTSKIKSIMTESVMTNDSVILSPKNLLESQSKVSVIERGSNHCSTNSNYNNFRTISNSKEISRSMFKKELETIELLFNGNDPNVNNKRSKEEYNLEKYDEISRIVERALSLIKSIYQPTIHKEQYEKEEASHVISNSKVNQITHPLYYGIFNQIFESIVVIPNYIARHYINLQSLPFITVCFLKPLILKMSVLNIALCKEEFISVCFQIYSKMTLVEKAKLIEAYKLCI